MRHAERTRITVAIIIAVMTACAPAWAEVEQLPDRFMLRLGGYQIRDADTIVRLEANNQPAGAYIDFHETLGGETSATVFRLDGLYRFNERHGIGLGWYGLKFNGSKVLDKEIDWAGRIYPVNTKVDSEIKFGIYKVDYQYSLFHNEKVELGASFGFNIMKISTSVVAQGINQSGSKSVSAPLPVWGLFADYKFTPRFSAYYSYQFFFVNFQDKTKGGIQDFLFGLEYRLFRNVALGAAYNRFGIQLESKGEMATLNFDTNWNGGMLYGAVYF
jgi:Outer membrane protein beta-barrel domain